MNIEAIEVKNADNIPQKLEYDNRWMDLMIGTSERSLSKITWIPLSKLKSLCKMPLTVNENQCASPTRVVLLLFVVKMQCSSMR